MNPYEKYTAVYAGPDCKEKKTVNISTEYSLTLSVCGNYYISIACSSEDLDILAIGYLVSDGLIQSPDEIEAIDIDYENLKVDVCLSIREDMLDRFFRIRSIASGCGQSYDIRNLALTPVESQQAVDVAIVTSSMKKFLSSTEMHKLTRGVHSAALYTTSGEPMLFYNEIGRHNAIDKIFGNCFLNDTSLEDTMLLSTGRISSEILYKAVYAGAPAVVSRAMPTTKSIDIARKYNIMLICGVSGNNIYIFHGDERVRCAQKEGLSIR